MSDSISTIYESSYHTRNDTVYFIAKSVDGKKLVVQGPDVELFDGNNITEQGKHYKHCPLTVENAKVLMQLFEFTRPVSHKGHGATIGLGDRLGIASTGHLRLIRNLDVFPVLAQQSIRELTLTGRTFDDVLSAAAWAVFQEGYTKGYGADGDHLKTHEEVKLALDSGFTMITLDCSEHIPNGLQAVVSFAIDIYKEFIQGKDIDFELSIDETETVTTPEDHRFVASKLKGAGVALTSLAPRFVGEFQKGIDYRGDLLEFERDFRIHAQIAKEYGYKISIHSGSDKFSVFPIVSKLADGKYHLKTAGTNWLEAIRVIATNEPELYRKLHNFALDNLPEARKYYHITCDVTKIKSLDSVSDADLPYFLYEDDARQVLHITYGLILQEKNPDDSLRFRNRIYKALDEHESAYIAALEKHIGNHLSALGVNL